MKELTIEEKAKRYDEAIERAKEWYNEKEPDSYTCIVESIFPELKESEVSNEDEKIRRAIIEGLKEMKSSFHTISSIKIDDAICWLEKQSEQKPYGQRKECSYCQFNYAGECKGSCQMKRDEQIYTNKVKPKFKIKYADSVYNVLEIKDIAGVIFYGIEDELNHIDYIKADNCKIINSDYGKESSFSIPTKSVMFSEQKPTWSECDENVTDIILSQLQSDNFCGVLSKSLLETAESWLKSLKNRILSK